MTGEAISPRQRVKTALQHREPDRTPVDFLAVAEIWERLIERLKPDVFHDAASEYIDPGREAVLRLLEVDCRVLSYDQFFAPPDSVLMPGAEVEWWRVPSRSTPARMWRQRMPGNVSYDCWQRRIDVVTNQTGSYEEYIHPPLGDAGSASEIETHPWPDPDWWDFRPLRGIIEQLDACREYHIRFRIGSVFEIAWQLRGFERFLMDLALEPRIPLYIMDRLTDVYVEITRRALDLIGDRLDMVYFYDDVATRTSLMISPKMWREFIRPRHARLIEVARSYEIPVMYHCDGAVYPLIPELIDLGVTLLNPIQPDAEGMDSRRLKDEFGDRLSFHGGVDIIRTLPRGGVEEVRNEVLERISVLGRGGGYIMAGSHHIQPDTPVENILAMYDPALR